MPKVEVIHVTNPLCSWSWGYEPVMNRLEALYGKQVEFITALAVPYTSREKWLEDYGMTAQEAIDWTNDEVRPLTRLPFRTFNSWSELPESCLPATIAVTAAGIVHGPKAAKKLTRDFLYATFIEGRETSQDKVLEDVITKAGLDNARMVEVAKSDAIDRAMEADANRVGHGGNFYSIFVRDKQGDGSTNVQLSHAYDAVRVERAIDYMAGKKLNKKKLTDVEAYVEEHGPVCPEEIQTAFAMKLPDARAKLQGLEKKGRVERVATPGVKTKFYKATA